MPVTRHTLVLVAVVTGGLAVPAAAQVAPTEPAPAPSAPPTVRLAPAPAPVPAIPASGDVRAACLPPRPAGERPATVDQVRAAFGVLRRERGAQDELPAAARRQLVRQGYPERELEGARLVRTTASGGKAWAVPVARLQTLRPFLFCASDPRRGLPPALPVPPRSARPPRRPSLPETRVAPRPRRARPAGPPPARETLRAPRPLELERPGAGVVVVATGDAPGGAGGGLRELVRGLSSVEVRTCTGADGTLLSVSGLVPDGVGVVHLTRADGTAVRAEVRDNAYAFQVPPQDGQGATYVTWTGGDGTPHVQPVAVFGGLRCAQARRPRGRTPAPGPPVRVSPGVSLVVSPAELPPALPAPAPRRP